MITKLRKFLEKKDQTKAFEKYAETFRPHPSQIWASFFYEGYDQNYERTREVIEAMVECVIQLEHMVDDDIDQPEQAIANLRAKLDEAEGE